MFADTFPQRNLFDGRFGEQVAESVGLGIRKARGKTEQNTKTLEQMATWRAPPKPSFGRGNRNLVESCRIEAATSAKHDICMRTKLCSLFEFAIGDFISLRIIKCTHGADLSLPKGCACSMCALQAFNSDAIKGGLAEAREPIISALLTNFAAHSLSRKLPNLRCVVHEVRCLRERRIKFSF